MRLLAQIARGISARARAAASTEATTVALERRLSSRRESMRLDSMVHAAGGEGPPPIAEESGDIDLEAEVRVCACLPAATVAVARLLCKLPLKLVSLRAAGWGLQLLVPAAFPSRWLSAATRAPRCSPQQLPPPSPFTDRCSAPPLGRWSSCRPGGPPSRCALWSLAHCWAAASASFL